MELFYFEICKRVCKTCKQRDTLQARISILYITWQLPPPHHPISATRGTSWAAVGWASLTATSSLIKNYSITHYLYICMLFTSVTTHLHTLTYLNVFVWFLENREAPNLFIDKLNNRYPISNLYQSYRSLSIMNIGMSQFFF